MTDSPVENHPCVGCGQLDDHPMVHVMGSYETDDQIYKAPSFHFDCLPPEYESLLEGPQHAVSRAAVQAAREGTHGDDLRELIQNHPTDMEEA